MRARFESLERAGLVTALTVAVSLAACSGCQSDGGPQRGMVASSTDAPPRTADTVAPSPTTAQSGPMADAADSIGVATMEPDGTIVLQLRAEGPSVIGDAQLRYPTSHKDYKDVLTHLGGLKPGESKPVPPWP